MRVIEWDNPAVHFIAFISLDRVNHSIFHLLDDADVIRGPALAFPVEQLAAVGGLESVEDVEELDRGAAGVEQAAGLDVALEALRDGWAQRKFTMDEIWHFATVDRVANVMRPYLESVTT